MGTMISDQKKIPKEVLGLAGEYVVASELCKRGLYSQLTLGNHKRTEILVETDNRVLRISVKAKQGYEWPAVNGPVRPDDFIVFVDFAGKIVDEKLDFYVMNLEDWKQFLGEEFARYGAKGRVLKNKDGIVIGPDGFKGLSVRVKQIAAHKDRWDKITSAVNPEDTKTERAV
jgi:hypothetical protein